MFPLRRFQIAGHSMQPLFNPGDRVLINCWAYLFSSPKPGDTIAFQIHNNSSDILLKKVKMVTGDEILVMGINKQDSLKPGPISRKSVVGKVLTKY